jgi:hypothetical protein
MKNVKFALWAFVFFVSFSCKKEKMEPICKNFDQLKALIELVPEQGQKSVIIGQFVFEGYYYNGYLQGDTITAYGNTGREFIQIFKSKDESINMNGTKYCDVGARFFTSQSQSGYKKIKEFFYQAGKCLSFDEIPLAIGGNQSTPGCWDLNNEEKQYYVYAVVQDQLYIFESICFSNDKYISLAKGKVFTITKKIGSKILINNTCIQGAEAQINFINNGLVLKPVFVFVKAE